jgi:hypothetical protein
MKKIIFLLSLVILITGCSISNINDEDIATIIDEAIKSDNKGYNEVFNGYKFQLPQGFRIVGKTDNNIKLLNEDAYYYLYIDIVGRYHKTEIDYEEKKDVFLSKKINYNDKVGYVEIREADGEYFVVAEYNNSKIECILTKENLNIGVFNILKILSSVEYNDLIINTLIGENALSYQEEEYSLFESTRKEEYFMDYIKEYDTYVEDNTLVDEDVIE